MSYVFPPPALIPLVLSKFILEHVTNQFRLPIPVAQCWMEASWLLSVLNMWDDNLYWCPIIKDLFMDVLVGWVLKCLPLLHLTLWLLRDVCCTDKEFSSSVYQAVTGHFRCLQHGSTSSVERVSRLMCSKRYTKQCHICP